MVAPRAIVHRLEAAGVDRQEYLTTKTDLAVLKTDPAAMEARLTWRMVGLQTGGGLIIAVLKLTS